MIADGPVIRWETQFAMLVIPTGRYGHFVDPSLPCLNEKLGANFCAIPARGIQPENSERDRHFPSVVIPSVARDLNLAVPHMVASSNEEIPWTSS
jgi:hypothetical protein